MAGHSRSKNGVASFAYVPAIHVFAAHQEDVDARIRGHDGGFCCYFIPIFWFAVSTNLLV